MNARLLAQQILAGARVVGDREERLIQLVSKAGDHFAHGAHAQIVGQFRQLGEHRFAERAREAATIAVGELLNLC